MNYNVSTGSKGGNDMLLLSHKVQRQRMSGWMDVLKNHLTSKRESTVCFLLFFSKYDQDWSLILTRQLFNPDQDLPLKSSCTEP